MQLSKTLQGICHLWISIVVLLVRCMRVQWDFHTFYPLRSTPLFAICSMELEIEYTISNYLSLFLIAENGQNPIGTGGLVQCGIFQILFQL